MVNPEEWKLDVGDVVQVSPKHKEFPACLMMVNEVLPDDIGAYIITPDCNFKWGRFKWHELEYVGKSTWYPPANMMTNRFKPGPEGQ